MSENRKYYPKVAKFELNLGRKLSLPEKWWKRIPSMSEGRKA